MDRRMDGGAETDDLGSRTEAAGASVSEQRQWRLQRDGSGSGR